MLYFYSATLTRASPKVGVNSESRGYSVRQHPKLEIRDVTRCQSNHLLYPSTNETEFVLEFPKLFGKSILNVQAEVYHDYNQSL
jgi:hypothetical protein